MKKNNNEEMPTIFGLGLRSTHYNYLESKPTLFTSWFEIISENYFRTQGRPRKILELLRRDYPISCHGVSLSIASYEDFDWRYLNDLKVFYDEIDPFIVSDHLCFTGLKNNNLHNLLPFAYNRENLLHISSRIDQVQHFFGRTFGLENLSVFQVNNFFGFSITKSDFICSSNCLFDLLLWNSFCCCKFEYFSFRCSFIGILATLLS